MFDRCRVWRHRLTRRGEGLLPPDQCRALEAHLASCSQCRKAAEADRALHSVLHTPVFFRDAEAVEAFNTVVLAALQAQAAPNWRQYLGNLGRLIQSRWNTLPTGFFTQIAAGALLAASVTAFCLMSALSPSRSVTVNTTHLAPDSAALSLENNAPPVPLETLLEHPSPRAALLWTTPAPPQLDTHLPPQNRRRPEAADRNRSSEPDRPPVAGF